MGEGARRRNTKRERERGKEVEREGVGGKKITYKVPKYDRLEHQKARGRNKII